MTAGTTANTYRVDYGTTLTVTATPDATHYLATLGGVTMGSNTAKDTTFADLRDRVIVIGLNDAE